MQSEDQPDYKGNGYGGGQVDFSGTIPHLAPVRLPILVENKLTPPTELLDNRSAIWRGDCEAFLSKLPREPTFDLVVTSPPYNIGKKYEPKSTLKDYVSTMLK